MLVTANEEGKDKIKVSVYFCSCQMHKPKDNRNMQQ